MRRGDPDPLRADRAVATTGGPLSGRRAPKIQLRHGEGDKHHLTSLQGLVALSLDALSSVAYGPEAIALVLVAAGSAAVGHTLPITLAIAALLILLVISYRQVIAAYPDGGGSYAVAKQSLGPRDQPARRRRAHRRLRAHRGGQPRRGRGEPGLRLSRASARTCSASAWSDWPCSPR